MIVEHFFPFLKNRCGVPALRKLVRDHDMGKIIQDQRVMEWIRALHEQDWPKVHAAMIETDRQWMIDNEVLTPAGSSTINSGTPGSKTLPRCS